MKKILAILLVSVSLNGYSQKVDTVRNSVQIEPLVVNPLKGDTAYQITWRINVERGGENIGYAAMFNKLGNKIHDFNFIVPKEIMAVWLEDKVIDDFICNKYKLKVRK